MFQKSMNDTEQLYLPGNLLKEKQQKKKKNQTSTLTLRKLKSKSRKVEAGGFQNPATVPCTPDCMCKA